MKKNMKVIIPIAVIAIVGIIMIPSVIKKYDSKVLTNKQSVDDNLNNDYEVYYENDYLYMKPEDLFNHSSLVVIGEYTKSLNSYVGDDQRAHTKEQFKVDKVIKGDYKFDNIVISRTGGTISLEEYIKTQSKEQIEKKGLNKLSKEEIKTSKVKFISEDYNLDLKENSNQKYILLLNYSSKNDEYVASSDEYSILKYNPESNEIYNILNKRYEKTDFVK